MVKIATGLTSPVIGYDLPPSEDATAENTGGRSHATIMLGVKCTALSTPCRVLKKWKRRVLIGDAKNRTLKELKEANKAAEIHLGNFPMKHSQVKKGYNS